MKKIVLALVVLLVAATLVTKAQNATAPVSTSSPTVSKFNDIVQVNFNEISSQQN